MNTVTPESITTESFTSPVLTGSDQRTPISFNGFSVDQQINDAVNSLGDGSIAILEAFHAAFPEYATLTWEGSRIDAEASGVDAEYMSWVTDWIETNTSIYWEDGEPWLGEGTFPEENVTEAGYQDFTS